jgi:hypothetical protein
VDIGSAVIGFFALGFGIVTAVIRKRSPERFPKLQAMKERLGEKAGSRLHIVGYSLVPILVGIIFLLAGFFGISIFSF